MNLLAIHFTWGTYGTRLHGDPRGTVDRQHNEFNTPVLGYDEHRWEREKQNLNFPPIIFTPNQMRLVEELIPLICERGLWKFHTCAAGPDHVHVILTSDHGPATIRRLLKRWLSQELSQRFALPTGAVWWAECGSIRWIDSERYFANAIKYVRDQRATPAS